MQPRIFSHRISSRRCPRGTIWKKGEKPCGICMHKHKIISRVIRVSQTGFAGKCVFKKVYSYKRDWKLSIPLQCLRSTRRSSRSSRRSGSAEINSCRRSPVALQSSRSVSKSPSSSSAVQTLAESLVPERSDVRCKQDQLPLCIWRLRRYGSVIGPRWNSSSARLQSWLTRW